MIAKINPMLSARQTRLAGVAIAYMVVAETVANAVGGQGATRLLAPASGFALGLSILGGRGILPALFVGALLSQALAGAKPPVALIEACAAVLGPFVGASLLSQRPGFDKNSPTLVAVSQLLLLACGIGAGAAALLAATASLAVGELAEGRWLLHLLQSWMGAALGMMLVAPFLLSYRHALRNPEPLRRVKEGALVWGLAAAAGWLIFARVQVGESPSLANAYWMFLFVSWSGARLGLLSTTALLNLVALIALWGSYQQRGFFARDIVVNHGFGFWSYMMILATVGLSLAAYLAERRRQKAELRIAAIAFECHEGLLITDSRGRILRANQSFLKLSGYVLDEVVGRTPDFLTATPSRRSSNPDSGCRFNAPQYVQQRGLLARKDGSTFPAWITVTPVSGRGIRPSSHVITLSDISVIERREKHRRAREQAHRQALVQEVHHRIKNNLQGIMGMLRELDQQHPVLHEPIDRMIDHLNSIAIIHGLQGRSQADEVRLCELTRAIATGIEESWSTPISVDIPPNWLPCRIAASHAVSIALVLNELIVNAVKHGGRSHQDVRIVFRKGASESHVHVLISNPGEWPERGLEAEYQSGMGWGLVLSLVPRYGITFVRSQMGKRAVLHIEISSPIIHAESS